MSDDQLPKAVSESVLTVAGFPIRVYHLDDGRRMLDADDVEKFFGNAELTQELADRMAADLSADAED